MKKITRLKEIEKEYGVDFGEDSNMKLSDYLRKIGVPSLAKLLERIEPPPKEKKDEDLDRRKYEK